MFGEESVINSGWLFSSGIESDAALAIGFITFSRTTPHRLSVSST